MSKPMMFVVTYKTKPNMRREFYDRVVGEGIIEASKNENGNEKYDYYFSPEDENAICLLEVWDSMETQKLHTQTAHFARLGELKAEYVLDTIIEKYYIENVE